MIHDIDIFKQDDFNQSMIIIPSQFNDQPCVIRKSNDNKVMDNEKINVNSMNVDDLEIFIPKSDMFDELDMEIFPLFLKYYIWES